MTDTGAQVEQEDHRWPAALDRALSQPDAIRLALQPIADLRRGTVVGHEVLARFPGPPQAPPDRWFAAAHRTGRDAQLAARTVQLGLERLELLPPNTFLTLNLGPQHLDAPEVLTALDASPRLDRLFIEVTEHAVIERPDLLEQQLAALRERGARVAVDDAGAGYAGLSLLLALRPDLIKLDIGLIAGIDRDPAKRVLVRAMGELADTIDAWVLAEGIETPGELAELVALEVPLGQGYLFGHPQATFTAETPQGVLAVIADRRQRNDYSELVASLQERAPLAGEHESPGTSLRIIVDELDRPVAIETGDGTRRMQPLLAKPSEPLAAVAQRLTARPDGRWMEPVVVTDGQGTAVGILPVDRLLEQLARQAL